ncbi:MAG: hypothetical protein LBC19_03370, partial [Tannerella sp.]|nr:hypothetical protein [Tannerella sp.]
SERSWSFYRLDFNAQIRIGETYKSVISDCLTGQRCRYTLWQMMVSVSDNLRGQELIERISNLLK